MDFLNYQDYFEYAFSIFQLIFEEVKTLAGLFNHSEKSQASKSGKRFSHILTEAMKR